MELFVLHLGCSSSPRSATVNTKIHTCWLSSNERFYLGCHVFLLILFLSRLASSSNNMIYTLICFLTYYTYYWFLSVFQSLISQDLFFYSDSVLQLWLSAFLFKSSFRSQAYHFSLFTSLVCLKYFSCKTLTSEFCNRLPFLSSE